MKRIRRLQKIITRFRLKGIRFLWLQKLNELKLLKNLVVIEFPDIKHPVYLRPGTSDFTLFRNIFIDEEYNINLPFTPATIIDGGANIGLAAIVFANKYPDAKIVSIEPENSNYEMLQKNIAPYKNVSSIKAGIWRNSSYLNVTNPQSGKWAFIIEETDEPDNNSIKGISINDIITQSGWDGADLIKLDVEGSEKEIFENNPGSWLSTAKGLIIELHDWIKDNCSDAVYRATNSLNFHISQKGENTVFTNNKLTV